MAASKPKTRTLLTPRSIAALKSGEWCADPAPRGEGVLQARKLADGSIAFYYRYTNTDGRNVRLPIGSGITLAEARERRRELSRRYQSGERDLHAALAAEEREQKRQREAAQRAAEAEAVRQQATLGALLTAYCDQLQRDGKQSARGIRGEIYRHVRDAWPKLWETPLTDIDAEALLAIVAVPANAGKLRQAQKLRSYLRAAYAAAIKARHNAKALPTLRALRVTTNPARDLATIEGANGKRDRALSIAELRAYWKRICALPDPGGAALRFHLLTGGQRVLQLARATVDDYDEDTQTLRLLDPKGRRSVARQHYVPLIPAALEAMRDMRGGALGPYLFTLTAGQSGADFSGVHKRAQAVAGALLEAGELPGGPFTPGDLRRTVETRLAAEGISADVRAHLQSHGLGGVQARHYDRHDYLAEKRAALETLHRLLIGQAAKVTPLRRKRKA